MDHCFESSFFLGELGHACVMQKSRHNYLIIIMNKVIENECSRFRICLKSETNNMYRTGRTVLEFHACAE